MCQRTQFIALHQSGLFTTTELCTRFGISRKTGYKWLSRFEQDGPEALKARSHATRSCPHKTAPEIEQLLIQVRRDHPRWGPKKLLAYTAKRHPQLGLPAASSVGDLLRRSGLILAKRPRRWTHPGSVPLTATAPNQVWCADFKGQFKMADGQYCFPLTVTDAYSRCLLACDAQRSTETSTAMTSFERLFHELGLPEAIRTDNGVPFVTPAIGGLSHLNLWWTRLGIVHQRIEPGKPQQNGRHERMHKTLKAEATKPAQRDLKAQQARFDAFINEFNHERPHEALGQNLPASLYIPSSVLCLLICPLPTTRSTSRCAWSAVRARFAFMAGRRTSARYSRDSTLAWKRGTMMLGSSGSLSVSLGASTRRAAGSTTESVRQAGSV
jgi:transposase InsO family protein